MQDVERAAGHIDPEIADGAYRMAREAADYRDREHDAGCRRKIILVRQPEHLHQVGHRVFAGVVLPVGIGDEAHRRVEREAFLDGGLSLGIERQVELRAHQHVENEQAADVEQQHADRVDQCVLFLALVDAGELVNSRSRQGAGSASARCARR